MDWSFGLIVDQFIGAGRSPGKALDELRDILSKPPWPDVDYWGTSVQDRRAATAMADLAGGPATMKRDEPEG